MFEVVKLGRGSLNLVIQFSRLSPNRVNKSQMVGKHLTTVVQFEAPCSTLLKRTTVDKPASNDQ